MIARRAFAAAPTFGPFFPVLLQPVINHAERLAAAVARAEADARLRATTWPSEPGADQVWLIGRAAEIEAFVSDALDDWRRGALTELGAAGVIGRYLDGVHREMTRRGGGAAPSCCAPSDDPTAVGGDHPQVHVGKHRSAPQQPWSASHAWPRAPQQR